MGLYSHTSSCMHLEYLTNACNSGNYKKHMLLQSFFTELIFFSKVIFVSLHVLAKKEKKKKGVESEELLVRKWTVNQRKSFHFRVDPDSSKSFLIEA